MWNRPALFVRNKIKQIRINFGAAMVISNFLPDIHDNLKETHILVRVRQLSVYCNTNSGLGINTEQIWCPTWIILHTVRTAIDCTNNYIYLQGTRSSTIVDNALYMYSWIENNDRLINIELRKGSILYISSTCSRISFVHWLLVCLYYMIEQ